MKTVYFVWLLSIALIPFFQGGYFYFEAFAFGAIQGVALLSIRKHTQQIILLKGYRLFLYGIGICAFLVWPFAVDKGMHPLGMLKIFAVILFLIVYDNFAYLFSHAGSGRTDECSVETSIEVADVHSEVSKVVIISGTLMALAVTVAVAFLKEDNPIVQLLVQKQRIGGFIQYANTFGIYLFICLVLLHFQDYKRTALYLTGRSIGTIFLTCGIVLTQSRATLFITVAYLCCAIFLSMLDRKTSGKNILLFLNTCIGVVVGFLVLRYGTLFIEQARVLNTSFQVSEWQTRLLYYDDSMSLLKKNIFGYGYLGYHYLQPGVQTESAYHVKFVHSGLIQMGLDFGIGGLVAFFFMTLFMPAVKILMYVKVCLQFFTDTIGIHHNIQGNVYSDKKEWDTDGVLLAVGIVGLVVHLFIDFDTEYLLIPIILVICLNILEVHGRPVIKGYGIENPSLQQRQGILYLKSRIMTMGAGLFLVVLFIYMGTVTAMEYFGKSQTAVSLYPLYTEAIESILSQKPDGADLTKEQQYTYATKILMQNPYNIKGVAFLAQYDYNNSKMEASLKRYKQLIELAPLRFDYLETYATVAIDHCEQLADNGLLTADNEDLNRIIHLESYISQLKASKDNNYSIINRVRFETTPKMKKAIVKGQELHENLSNKETKEE